VSKAPRRPPTPTHGQTEKEPEELPVFEGYIYGKIAKGWILVEIESQGDRIISKNVLSRDPEPRTDILRKLFNTVFNIMAKPSKASA